jgi:hypothetical protein
MHIACDLHLIKHQHRGFLQGLLILPTRTLRPPTSYKAAKAYPDPKTIPRVFEGTGKAPAKQLGEM